MSAIKYAVFTLMLATGAGNVKAQTGDEIIQKHIDATGGEATWAKVTSLKLKGGMTVQGMEVGITNTILQNKGVRMDMTIMGMSGYTIITPTAGWMYMPAQGITKPTPLPAEQLKGAGAQMNIRYVFMADKSTILKSEYAGKDTANNTKCVKVKVTETDSTIKTLYFDEVTFNMVRAEGVSKSEGEEVKETMNYSNFTKLPEGITIAMTWGTPQGDIVYKTAEVNKPIDESIFKPSEAEMKK